MIFVMAQKGAPVIVHPSQEKEKLFKPYGEMTSIPCTRAQVGGLCHQAVNRNHFSHGKRFVLQPDKGFRPNLPGAFGAEAAQDMFADLAVAAAGDIA